MKFRIWNKSLEKFVPKNNWFVNGNGEIYYYDDMDDGIVKANLSICVLQRHTGVKDVGGDDIYEGDLLLDVRDDQTSTVFWNDTHSNWEFGFNTKHVKIVGNIFEKKMKSRLNI